jgi:hypothetical protein
MKSPQYDEDFYLWTQEMAGQLRAGRFDRVDVENVAEEIESLGRSDKRQLYNRLERLLMHLLKERLRGKSTASWRSTLAEQRVRVRRLLKDSPSLAPLLAEAVKDVYPDAVERAAIEMNVERSCFPAVCPFPLIEILGADLPR